MENRKIHSALISVYSKHGLEPILYLLQDLNVKLYSTGGTQAFIQGLGLEVESVEHVTSYPSILDGRVKTLHPKVFGGILAKREPEHLEQLKSFDIPEIDLVIVDLYPFEDTLAQTTDEKEIIEKIDIGGLSLIRAAAKNYKDMVVVPSRGDYHFLEHLLKEKSGSTDLEDRLRLAKRAFQITAQYDHAIHDYFSSLLGEEHSFRVVIDESTPLRYGENPHQKGTFYGNWTHIFDQLHGKQLSYNNLMDIDAAYQLICEFKNQPPTFAVIKHTNPCGVASRGSALEAWQAALAGDPVSAFGGIIACNGAVDVHTATSLNELFFEVLLAPSFTPEALELLKIKKNRILLRYNGDHRLSKTFRSFMGGVLAQDADLKTESSDDFTVATQRSPTPHEIADLIFAGICAKHIKSNAIALVKNGQLIGSGCGQTSRVDALQQAIEKTKRLGFDPAGSVMASDAFFPFPDCVEIAHKAGITAVVHPGGSIRDQESIDYCNAHDMAMVLSGTRHFRH